MKDYNAIKFICKEDLDRVFLHRITRSVSKTALVSIDKKKYEVGQEFVGIKNLELRYDPLYPDILYVYRDFKQVGIATPVKTVDNSKRKRQTLINYEEMDGKENV